MEYTPIFTNFAAKPSLMIISIRLKNFYSLRDDSALDFTADMSSRKLYNWLPENLLDFSGEKFINIIGLFGSNAAGKSNIIKAIDFCRNLVVKSHLNNEGDTLDFSAFKFGEDNPSEFYINFVTEGVEYEYGFKIQNQKIISESLYHYPNKRKAKVFERSNIAEYTYGKKILQRPTEIEANTGSKTLFLSRASSMNRQIAQTVYKFFLNEMVTDASNFDITTLSRSDLEDNKDILLKAFEVSDSDIVDIVWSENIPGVPRLLSFHKENPTVPFDFEKEESEGTKRLLFLLLTLLKKITVGATVFIDEFDLKMHLRLAEFILDVVRASHNMQMVFTSHNPYLIDTTKLRREQIVFVNKQTDGNSEFMPLSDFEGISNNTDIRKAYLQGRFDAVPYVGEIYPIISEIISKK